MNDVVVHGFPGEYELQDGDIVSVDSGVYMNGYHGDSAYTFAIGNVKPDVLKSVVVALAAVGAVIAGQVRAQEVVGAGASFPAPIYAKWADAYKKATGNKINYQSIGSGGGIKQIMAKTANQPPKLH